MEAADGLTLMLSNVTLNQGRDKWMIPEGDNGRFTTKWLRRKIEHFRIQSSISSTYWHKWVPKIVKLLYGEHC